MHVRRIETGPAAAPAPLPGVDLSLETQVQNALNLYLPMKNPTQLPGLVAMLQAAQPKIYGALKSLHYVHFARFLPMPDGSALWVITEYDGALESYVMDFVAVLGDVFTNILQFVRGAPRLPVQKHAREFTEYVVAQNIQLPRPWSAYPDLTVIDILRTGRRL